MAQIVRQQCRRAIVWLHREAATLGFDCHRIVVAGSSAGAHLAAMRCRAASRPPA
ncbi:MAG: alpha/beta hydrolase fold domain-containing protein [Rubrivivax sp.]